MPREPFRQVLPALELSIERYTPEVPHDGRWYLMRAGTEVGRYRSLKEARAAWAQVVAESGWTPPKRELDAKRTLEREAAAKWARNRGG